MDINNFSCLVFVTSWLAVHSNLLVSPPIARLSTTVLSLAWAYRRGAGSGGDVAYTRIPLNIGKLHNLPRFEVEAEPKVGILPIGLWVEDIGSEVESCTREHLAHVYLLPYMTETPYNWVRIWIG